MFRPCVASKNVGHLAEGVSNGFRQGKGIRYLGSSGSGRNHRPNGQPPDCHNRSEGNQWGQPLFPVWFFRPFSSQNQNQEEQRKQGQIPFMDKTDCKIQDAGCVKLLVPAFFIQKQIQTD